jgi:membrane protein DedA with SNARE-associated domain
MMHTLQNLVTSYGYAAVFVLMALESACVPIPSEVTMPVAGFLASGGHLDLWAAGGLGVLGNLAGSWVAYAVGATGGRAVVLRWGRYVRVREHDLDRAERWFAVRGEVTVFWSRLLPVVRTFISLPAGIARMKLGRFSLYTALGCIPWSFGLAAGGYYLGENWQKLARNVELVSFVIAAAVVVGIVVLLVRSRRTSPG